MEACSRIRVLLTRHRFRRVVALPDVGDSVLAADGHALQRLLADVVVDSEEALRDVRRERSPLILRVLDREADRAAGQDDFALGAGARFDPRQDGTLAERPNCRKTGRTLVAQKSCWNTLLTRVRIVVLPGTGGAPGELVGF